MKRKLSWDEIQELVRSAIRDFKRNKVRTFLTAMGIMIGVLSVVLLIALGLGLKNYLKQQFENLGANLVLIMPGTGINQGGGGGFGGPAGLFGGADFDEKDVSNLKRINEAEYVVPVYFSNALVEAPDAEEYGYLMGMSEDIFPLMNLTIYEGEAFTKSDINSRSKKVVLGFTLAEDLYDEPEDAVGTTVRFKNQRFKVVGVADKKGDNEMDQCSHCSLQHYLW